MTETKFTKGPWRVCGGYTAAYQAVTSDAGYIVFGMADYLEHMEGGDTINAPCYTEQQANAKLIASSPEMYAVCQMIVDEYWGDDPSGDLQSIARAAKDTLAKARGE